MTDNQCPKIDRDILPSFQDQYEYAHTNYKWCQNMNTINHMLNNQIQSAD